MTSFQSDHVSVIKLLYIFVICKEILFQFSHIYKIKLYRKQKIIIMKIPIMMWHF